MPDFPSQKHRTQHWTILGPGAIGSLWAVYLLKSGYRVTLLGPHARSGTLRIKRDDQLFEAPIAVMTPEQCTDDIEYLLVTTKAHDTLLALEKLRPQLSTETTIIILQNGMAAQDVVKRFPSQAIYAAVTTDGAYREDPLTIIHAGQGQMYFGSLNSHASHQQSQALLQNMPVAYLNIKLVDNIQERLWKKLAINCAVNALTVKYQCRNGELLAIPDAVSSINTLCEEIRHIAGALKIPVNFGELETDVVEVLQCTAQNYSSMYQDIKQQRATEIDYLNGYLCREAARLNIPCPLNQQLLELVKNY